MPESDEIADSDADSGSEEIEALLSTSGHKQGSPPPEPPPHGTTTDITANNLDVDFEDFLSQSQKYDARISQPSPLKTTSRSSDHAPDASTVARADNWSTRALQSELQVAQSYLLDGSSTDMSMRLQSSDSPNAAKLKRRQTDLGSQGKDGKSLHGPDGPRRKRARTEAAGNEMIDGRNLPRAVAEEREGEHEHREQPTSHTEDKEKGFDELPDTVWPNSSTGKDAPNAFIHPAKMHLDHIHVFDAIPPKSSGRSGPDSDEEDDIRPRKRAKSGEFRSLLHQSGSTTTSQSTMGNYQTYNIDYRGQSSSLALTANPFAAECSQASDTAVTNIDGKTQLVREVPRASISRSRSTSRPPTDSLSQSSQQPSPTQGHRPGKKPLATYSRRRSKVLSSDREDSDVDELAGDADVTLEDRQCSEASKPSKKRGRPPKDRREAVPPVRNHSAARNHLSDNDDDSLNKERSRRRSILSESDNDGEEAKLPKNGRPQNAVDDPAPSPEKNPSSGLHLSDETLIGLPKENYKPRPSRSRSKRLEEDEGNIVQTTMTDAIESPTQQAKADTGQMLPPPPRKGRKQAKSKVKRAKTYVPLKSSEMIDEEDRDVLWVDTKPAAVKLNIPSAELSPVKKEKTEGKTTPPPETEHRETEIYENNAVMPADLNPKSLVSVEIPAATSVVQQEAPSEPKRRGRKKKATLAVDDLEAKDDHQADPPMTAETGTAGSEPELMNTNTDAQASKDRQPLSEKPVNQPSMSHSRALDDADLDQENRGTANAMAPSPDKVSPATPRKDAQFSGDSPIEKGPTKHSPIKQSDSAVKFRVGLSRKQRIPPLLRMVRK